MEFRIQQIIKRTDMTGDEATAYIQKIDAERRAWNLFLYGIDWLSPSLYDLTINLENMSIETAVELVATGVKRPEFVTTPQSQKTIDDLAVATRVKAVLAADPATAPAEIELTADSGSGIVNITAAVRPPDLRNVVLEKIRGIEGVCSVAGPEN
jgi:hypothetical protein